MQYKINNVKILQSASLDFLHFTKVYPSEGK